MRTTMTVTAEDCLHDADRVDPSAPGYGAHLPFHTILQRCGLAWRWHLAGLGDGAQDGARDGPQDGADGAGGPLVSALDTGVIVPNVNADFRAEVHVGTLHIDVGLVRVGTTSFTLRCDVVQDDVLAARVDVVLVSFDYGTRTPLPLSDEQRRLLGPVQVPQ